MKTPSPFDRDHAVRATALPEEIAEHQHRLARAEAERDTWRASGLQEKYLEACSHVAALELQLERLQPGPRP